METQQQETQTTQHRIKSFVLRQGRMSNAQQGALERVWPLYGLAPQGEILDFTRLFGRSAPTYLEIGFGMGTSLAAMAKANPDRNYIGIEVHRPGVGALCKLIEEQGLSNIRLFNHDAIEVLAQRIPLNSLAGVYLFFPDPWHKARHKKRRILNAEFADKIGQYLTTGGEFHMATDWQDYAEQMMAVMTEAQGYQNKAGTAHYMPRPDYRPLTKFEQRGQRLGHGVWDLIFVKND
jgi:tRNA (guanine-N7-)-methyltransferase